MQPISSAGWILLLLYQLIFFTLYEMTWHRKGSNRVLASVFKSAVTLSDLVLACVLSIRQPTAGHLLICLGLMAGTVADYVLNFRFILGMAIFGTGHILYCLSFLSQGAVKSVNILVTLGLLALIGLIIILFRHRLQKLDPKQSAVPFVAYAFISCVLVGLACTQPPMIQIGSILFVASDVLLALRFIMHIPNKSYECFNLFVYYAAQLLIALGAAL